MKYAEGMWQFEGLRRLPMILQTEITECGLACVTMIAAYHGHDVDLSSLRRRFPISLRGANLSSLIAIARELGLQGRGLRAELEQIGDLQVPCILHWEMNHFVVLKKVTSRHVEIHDPARGALKLSWSEASRRFTGVALELTRSADFTPVRDREHISLRKLTGQIFGIYRAALQIVALALGLEVLGLLVPFQLQWVLDQVLVSADVSLLTLLGCAFLIVVVMRAMLSMARGWAISSLSATINAQWSVNLFAHLLRLPLEYFEKRHVGDVLSRFMSIQIIQQTVTGSFTESLLDGVTALFMLGILFVYSPELAGLVIVCNVLYLLAHAATFSKLSAAKEEQFSYIARQQTEMYESVHGVQTIKLSNKQGERQARFANATGEVASRDVAIQRFGFSFGAVAEMVFGIQRVVIIWIAAYLVLGHSFSAGMLIVCVAYADQFTTRMRSLIDKMFDFRLLRVHAERLADIALTAPEAHVESTYTGAQPRATIEVRDVRFRYAESEPWILNGCTLFIEEGESVAIVGASGCGKTTLAKLMLGLLMPAEGSICLGDVDIRKFGLGPYREQLSAVMQEDRLFSGSIADNISFFDPNASLDKIREVASIANIADDIETMSMGYETLVGDMGSSLSGGQKQRILLARALFREPRIILLDEATSHLDVSRERRISAEIARLKITRIIIAHRYETIASADRVIHLIDGQATNVSALEYRQERAQDELLIKPSRG